MAESSSHRDQMTEQRFGGVQTNIEKALQAFDTTASRFRSEAAVKVTQLVARNIFRLLMRLQGREVHEEFVLRDESQRRLNMSIKAAFSEMGNILKQSRP